MEPYADNLFWLVIRSGIQITQNLYYNSIDMPSSASAIPASADSIPVHIRTFWYCQDCKTTYSFNKMQATEHVLEKCSGNRSKQDNLDETHLVE